VGGINYLPAHRHAPSESRFCLHPTRLPVELLSKQTYEGNFITTLFRHGSFALDRRPIIHHAQDASQFARLRRILSSNLITMGMVIFRVGSRQKYCSSQLWWRGQSLCHCADHGAHLSTARLDGTSPTRCKNLLRFFRYSDMAIGLALLFGCLTSISSVQIHVHH